MHRHKKNFYTKDGRRMLLPICLLFLMMLIFLTAMAFPISGVHPPVGSIPFTQAQQDWIAQNRDKTFSFEYTDINNPLYFRYGNTYCGFLKDILSIFEEQTGVHINISTNGDINAIAKKLENQSIIGSFSEYQRDKTNYTENNLLFDCDVYCLKGNDLGGRDLNTVRLGYLVTSESLLTSLKEKMPHVQTDPYDDVMSLTAALKSGKIDGVVVMDFYSDQFKNNVEFSEVYLPAQYYFDFHFAGDKMFTSILDTILYAIDYKQTYRDNSALYNCFTSGLPLDVATDTKTIKNIRIGIYENPTFQFKLGKEMCGIVRQVTDDQKNQYGITHVPVYGSFAELCHSFLKGKIDVLLVPQVKLVYDDADIPLARGFESYKQYELYDSDIVLYGLYETPIVKPDHDWAISPQGKPLRIGYTNQLSFLHEQGVLVDNENIDYVYYKTTDELTESLLKRDVDYIAFNFYNEHLKYAERMSLKGVLGQYRTVFYVNDNPHLQAIYNLFYNDLGRYSYQVLRNVYADLLNYGTLLFESNHTQARLNATMHALFMKKSFVGFLVLVLALALVSLVLKSKLRREQKQSNLLEQTDWLTALPDRNVFYATLEEMTHTNEAFSLIVFEIDRLKEINEQYRHETGDFVLAHVANSLKATVGKEGYLGRIGGDEFAVAFKSADKDAAIKLVQQVILRVYHFEHNEISVKITLSVGICKFTPAITIPMLLKQTYDALAESKEKGRNTWTYAEDAAF